MTINGEMKAVKLKETPQYSATFDLFFQIKVAIKINEASVKN